MHIAEVIFKEIDSGGLVSPSVMPAITNPQFAVGLQRASSREREVEQHFLKVKRHAVNIKYLIGEGRDGNGMRGEWQAPFLL